MKLRINSLDYDAEYMKSYMLDEVLHIEFSDTSEHLELRWEGYHYNIIVNDNNVDIECLFAIHKLLWDLKYGKIKSLVVKYITTNQINAYRKYIYG